MDVSLDINTVFDLANIRELTTDLTIEEKKLIVEQALLLIDGVYAHLPIKTAKEAINPVQRLTLLYEKIENLEDENLFHNEMIDIFTSLRDSHTNYILPNSIQQFAAFLPFTIEEYFTNSTPRYIVSKVTPGYINNSTFIPGVEVTHWNGIPIRRFIEILAARSTGSNNVARRARTIYTLTTRPLSHTLSPDEDWVIITYTGSQGAEDVRVAWKAFIVPPTPQAPEAKLADSPKEIVLGLDDGANIARRTKKVLFAPQAMKSESQPPEKDTDTSFPDSLEFRSVKTPSGEFGYLRIRSFFVSDIEGFIKEVARVLKLLPQTGLILDVRDNPGGAIPAGEGLLQFFTDNKVIPAPVSFRNTMLNRLIVENFPPFEAWKKSIQLSVETGESFSQGFSLSPQDEINKIGRVYQGNVILITSPLSISTVDFLAAGFKDNDIGYILGIDTNMGAGGANVVTHEEIRTWLEEVEESPFKPLPKGVQMRVSIRRSTRVGRETIGLPVEGLGVEPDEIHRMTLNDLLNQNVDLIAHAGELLAKATL